MKTNSDEENEEKIEYERVFNFLDKNKRKKIGANDVIIVLGALGKIFSEKKGKKQRKIQPIIIQNLLLIYVKK